MVELAIKISNYKIGIGLIIIGIAIFIIGMLGATHHPPLSITDAWEITSNEMVSKCTIYDLAIPVGIFLSFVGAGLVMIDKYWRDPEE